MHVFNLFQHFTVLTLVFKTCSMLMLSIINTNADIMGVIASYNGFKKSHGFFFTL